MGVIAAGSIVYWGLVFGTLSAIVMYFNNDYEEAMEEKSAFNSLFSSGHDGTPYGKVKHWLDTLVKNWKGALTLSEGTLPEMVNCMWENVLESSIYIFRGLSLGVIYFTIQLSEFLGLTVLEDILQSGTVDTIIKFAIFNATVIVIIIIEIYVMTLVLYKRKQRKSPSTVNQPSRNDSQLETKSSKSHVSTVPTSQLSDFMSMYENHHEASHSTLGKSRNQSEVESAQFDATQSANMQPQNPQDQGKSLELWRGEAPDTDDENGAGGSRDNNQVDQPPQDSVLEGGTWEDADMDLKTMAMFAYITDCEAYEEEDLRRQNSELRRQIEEGRDAFKDMDENKMDEIARLTKGMRKMLKQVRKESQFASYALDTLKTEKDVMNDELQRLLAMEPEELAAIKPSELFKNISSKVQQTSGSQDPALKYPREATRVH